MLIPGEDTLDEIAASPVNTRLGGRNESYGALVWRRLRRSVTGFLGLCLVSLILITSIFAEFFAPVDPKASDISFAPPETVSFLNTDRNLTPIPRIYPIIESNDLDPVTFQPLNGPDFEHPHIIGFFVHGFAYNLLGLIPWDVHLFGCTDGHTAHFLGTDKFGRDILSRGIFGSRISLTIALIVVAITTMLGTLVGMTSGYLGGRFDSRVQRFVELVLAFPQLPLYLALTSLIPVTAPTNVFLAFVVLVLSALGWAQLSREVRGKTLALANVEYVKAAIAIGASDRRIILPRRRSARRATLI